MDHVLAKVKGNSKKKIFKLLSSQSLFKSINIDDAACVEYDPDHKLDEDSWFKIESFTNKEYCIDLLKKEFDSKDYDDLPKAKFSEISFLCSYQEENFYFQKITPALFVSKKLIAFGEIAKIEKNEKRLVINLLPDAIYFKKTDILVFRNLATISSIFKGVEVLFKEATKEEVNEFLKLSFIKLSDGYEEENVSKPNRKRIALAKEAYSKMSKNDKTSMINYTNEYCKKKLTFDKINKIFQIKSDDDLKLLLYGILQRFYTTPIGQEKRLANSIQLI